MVKLEGLTEREIKENKLIKMTGDFLKSKEIPFKLIFRDSLDEYDNIPRVPELDFTAAERWYFSQALPRIGKSSFYVILKGCAIYVNPIENRIVTVSPIIFNDVVILARAYEEAGFGEFTVKKQYEE